MKYFSLIFFVCSIVNGLAADPKYAVGDIPTELKEKMYAVVREQKIQYKILSTSSTTFTYRKVITILNSKAKQFATLSVHYDKFTSVKSIKATVYDKMGKEVKRLKQNEVSDQSTYDGFSIFSDDRIKTVNLSQGTYPYTVEMEYELEMKYLYSFPDFFLYYDDEVSAQVIEYSVVYPNNLKPRYRLFKVNEPKVAMLDGKNEEMLWQFINVIPDKFEPYSPPLHQVVPNLSVAPVDFDYGGYGGRMDSWKNYGLWQQKLNEGRGELAASTKREINELTAGIADKEEKARLVYNYLQNKTRYVSIQEGIGGMQPFPAALVDEVGYGDCKALSNYMVALLEEVGIKGYYTKIRAGENERDIIKNFPSHQSNHVIVAVPNASDTLWLECTSQTNPFGYLGTFTGDRFGLMVTEQGGKLVRTPAYKAEQNTQFRKATVNIDYSGNAVATIKTSYSGIQYETGGLDFIIDRSDKQKEWIERNTQIPSFDIVSYSFRQQKEKIPVATVELELKLDRLASVSGKRIFFTPNLMNRFAPITQNLENRKNNVVISTAYVDSDTIHYKLPEDFYPEFLPVPVKLKNVFGEYESAFSLDQGKIIYIRRLKMNKGEFPAESYSELTDFYKAIIKADNEKIVLVNKT
jgi:transglutaminase-like putative cysteine protease